MSNFLNNCVMFCIEILFVGKDSKKLFVCRAADGRPLLSSYDIAEVSAFIDDRSNLPKSQDNKSAN